MDVAGCPPVVLEKEAPRRNAINEKCGLWTPRRLHTTYLVHSLTAGGRCQIVQDHVYHRVSELVVGVSGVTEKSSRHQGLCFGINREGSAVGGGGRLVEALEFGYVAVFYKGRLAYRMTNFLVESRCRITAYGLCAPCLPTSRIY